MKLTHYKLLYFLLGIILISCNSKAPQQQAGKHALVETNVKHVDWAKNAVIYEVNIRQYTPEGTFKAFAEHLPRLKELGIDILWLMPIHPIGVENRKGELGSYYSVKDYKDVNPEYGTMDDFKWLVAEAHKQDMKIILDWVANHTAWDNPWMTEHPDFYKKDSTGKPFGPFDWTDVAQLDYDNSKLHIAMIDALKFWVSEADIDGYRCDVAGMVPVEFWEKARTELDKIKPVFMLAEDEQESIFLENAFDMNYGWELHFMMNDIAKGTKNTDDLIKYFEKQDSIYSKDCYRMQFITNHDENSWKGTEFERMGDGVKTFAVLSFTVPGMPLLYTGQEVGLNKRLEFFTKDEVPYVDNEFPEFYKTLIQLKKDNSVFWNGNAGGDFEIINTGNKNVFAFRRYNNKNEAVVILNLSDNIQGFSFKYKSNGELNEYFTKTKREIKPRDVIELAPWEYKVYIK